MSTPEWLSATLRVTGVLEALGVPYVIGGSIASILYGEVRTTMDAGLLADLRREHVEALVASLAEDFYLVVATVHEAITSRQSFNVIHRETMFKIDVFIPKGRAFDLAQLSRRVERIIARNPDRTAWIASPEDVVLAKLDWYEMGGRVSDRQWRDILGVLKTRLQELDVEYMRRSAFALGGSELLEQALAAARTR